MTYNKWLLCSACVFTSCFSFAQTSSDATSSCPSNMVLSKLSKISYHKATQSYHYTLVENNNNYFLKSGDISKKDMHMPMNNEIIKAKVGQTFCHARPTDYLEILSQAN